MQTTYESLWNGIDAVKPGARIYEIGRAIQTHAEANGFSVVRAFVGHGVGETFHTAPSVPHFYDPHSDTVIEPGMTFTIEPMINEGSWELGRIWSDGWTAPTRDGSRSAQFEHSLLVTPTGVEVLTLLPGDALPRRELQPAWKSGPTPPYSRRFGWLRAGNVAACDLRGRRRLSPARLRVSGGRSPWSSRGKARPSS